MPANEFEKQVNKKMEELQFGPSPAVWEKIEEQLKEKKRRRIIFFIIFPIAIGLLGFGLLRFLDATNSSSKKTENGKVTIAPQQAQPTENQISSGTKNSEENKNPGIVETPGNSYQSLVTPIKKDNNFAADKKQSSLSTRKQQHVPVAPINQVNNFPKNQNTTSSASRKNEHLKKDVTDKPDETIETPVNNINQQVNSNAILTPVKIEDHKQPSGDADSLKATVVNPENQIQITGDSAQKKIDSVRKDLATMDPEPVITEKETRITQFSKLKWGVNFAAGISGNHKSILSLQNSTAADSYGSPITGGASSPAAVTPPTTIRSGPAFRIGVVAHVAISARSNISTGVDYAYMSNRIKTGTGVDTSVRLQGASNFASLDVDRIYRGAPNNNYTNGFHFISIPVNYHWLINKQAKIPLHWNLGLSFSYLISTNALVYQPAYGGIYYENDNAFTRMHYSAGTGLSARLGKNGKTEWLVGPEVSFDMNPLLKTGQNQYLWYGGISMKMLWSKKKKN